MAEAAAPPRKIVTALDLSINLPTMGALVVTALSAYGVYRTDVAALREADIVSTGRFERMSERYEARIQALEGRISKTENDVLTSRADRELLIRIDGRLQRIERVFERDEHRVVPR